MLQLLLCTKFELVAYLVFVFPLGSNHIAISFYPLINMSFCVLYNT